MKTVQPETVSDMLIFKRVSRGSVVNLIRTESQKYRLERVSDGYMSSLMWENYKDALYHFERIERENA